MLASPDVVPSPEQMGQIVQLADWLEAYQQAQLQQIGQELIEEVSEFLKIPRAQMLKSLLYVAEKDNSPVMILIRGDQQLNEEKLVQYLKSPIRPAHPEEVQQWLGAPAGFIGPVNAPNNIKILADKSYPVDVPFATGANEK